MIIVLQILIFVRESLVATLNRYIRPYCKQLSLSLPFYNNDNDEGSDDEESEELQVFAEFHDEKGVVFFPPVYSQRYAAICDCLMDERWRGKLEKVVDLGYHDVSFIKHLKDLPGIKSILGVDLESIPLPLYPSFLSSNEHAAQGPLQIILFQGNAADPDYRLIGCDAVIAIEMIEHMLPHDLERLVHTVFGFIKPWVAVFTTPNADFNVLFKSLEVNGLRRLDHFFEWTREQFNDWCSNIVLRYPQYTVSCRGIGPGPPGTEHYGCCSQLALFVCDNYYKQQNLNLNSLALVKNISGSESRFLTETIGDWVSLENMNSLREIPGLNCTTLQVRKFSKTAQNVLLKNQVESDVNTKEILERIRELTMMLNCSKEDLNREVKEGGTWGNFNWGENAPYWNQYYKVVREYTYPFEVKSEESQILDLITAEVSRLVDLEYENYGDFDVGTETLEIPISHLMGGVQHITEDVDRVKDILEWNGYEIIDNILLHRHLLRNIPRAIGIDDSKEESLPNVKIHT